MTFDAKTNSNITLMKSFTKSCVDLECAICYKPINKTYFECGAPCSKTFHTGCMDKMMEQIEETADDSDEEPMYRCCYCRRDIDSDNYMLQLFAKQLITLQSCSHDVTDALSRVEYLIENNQKPDEDESFEYYELRDNTFIQKPKQPKRQILKKHVHKPRQNRIKQNIGGRRR
jgi:hypothetical protein